MYHYALMLLEYVTDVVSLLSLTLGLFNDDF
jgi:hypothetical protein